MKYDRYACLQLPDGYKEGWLCSLKTGVYTGHSQYLSCVMDREVHLNFVKQLTDSPPQGHFIGIIKRLLEFLMHLENFPLSSFNILRILFSSRRSPPINPFAPSKTSICHIPHFVIFKK